MLDRRKRTHDSIGQMFVFFAFQADNTPVPCDRWQFSHLPIRIGRNPDNDYSPQHPAISGSHAIIEDRDGKICIRDLGSRNGVFLPTPAGDGKIRIDAHVDVDLEPAGFRFYLTECVWVQLEIVQEEACSTGREKGDPNNRFGRATVIGLPAPRLPAQLPAQVTDRQHWAGPTAPTRQRETAPPGPPSPEVEHQSSGDEAPKSQFFQMKLDYLALQGLRELTRSLIPGRSLETTGDVARLITKLHDTVDVFCRCFVPLRQGYEQFVSSLELANQRSVNRSPAAAALQTATTPEAVAAALLDPHERSIDAPQALEKMFTDLTRHQIALLDGVMQGVRALLNELSPENIEAALGLPGTADLFSTKYRARWTEFCARYERLSDQSEAFAVIFGQDFAEAYQQYWRRESAKETGATNRST